MNNVKKNYYSELKAFHKRIEKELTVLLYHGVTRIKSKGIENYSGKHISEKEFVRQMRYIKKNCSILSIDDIVRIKIEKKAFPGKATVVSFDDGFRNVYSVAAPILHEFKIPFVFYVTSGIVNTDNMFWVDVLEDCINLTSKDRVSILLDKKYNFSLRNEKEKIFAIDTIKFFCKKNGRDVRNRIIEDLTNGTGICASVEHSRNYEKITRAELRELSNDRLCTIGGHSLYHDSLTSMPLDEAKKDIGLSIELLRHNLSCATSHYSYPEGQAGDFNEEIIKVLKKKKIVCCPSAEIGLNDKNTDLFHLKRIMVGFRGIGFPFFDRKL